MLRGDGTGFDRRLLAVGLLVLHPLFIHGEDFSIVFVQVPNGGETIAQSWTPKPIEGSRIVLYEPAKGETLIDLTAEFAGAQDPEISFDGRRILFSGKREASDSWDIWEMNRDGSGKRCLVARPGDDVQPIYTGCLNTLDDGEWDQVLFVGDAAGWYTEDGREKATALYTAKLDGSFIHRISFNLSSDFDPTILNDGRVLFTSWQQNTGRFPPTGLFPLMVMNTDGTDLMPFYGNHEMPRRKAMARETFDGYVVFVESDEPRLLGGGSLARVSMRRNLHTHEVLAEDSNGSFITPCPLPKGELMVSYRGVQSSDSYGIYLFDTNGRGIGKKIYDDPEWHDFDAQGLIPRLKPHGRSTVVNYAKPNGFLYCLNIYDSDRERLSGLPSGSIKRIRVIEGMPATAPGLVENESHGFALRRIVGEAPVEEDGSFHLEVPAMIPLSLQTLDENGLAVGTHGSWLWVMPMEKRGCIGCHEDRERTPFNMFTKANARRGNALTRPSESRLTVTFEERIWPLLQSSCVTSRCHGRSEGDAPYWGESSQEIYQSLLHVPDDRPAYVKPGSARDSRMMWALFGMILSGDHRGERFPQMPPPDSPQASDFGSTARQTAIEWIDLGAALNNPVRSMRGEAE